MKYKILIVEDHKEISDVVAKYLHNEGYEYVVANNGFEALSLFNETDIHLLLLDVMMPGIDGFEVLREIRNLSSVPVIMLTAKQEEVDRLQGFDLGADDYVIKPFSTRELMRRIHALLKRSYKTDDEKLIYKIDNLTIDAQSMKVYKDDIEIELTTAEFNLLLVFVKHQGQVLSRESIIHMVYGYDYEGYDRNIDSFIKRLRQKIEDDAKNPIWLQTKYGAGYRFGGSEQ